MHTHFERKRFQCLSNETVFNVVRIKQFSMSFEWVFNVFRIPKLLISYTPEFKGRMLSIQRITCLYYCKKILSIIDFFLWHTFAVSMEMFTIYLLHKLIEKILNFPFYFTVNILLCYIFLMLNIRNNY